MQIPLMHLAISASLLGFARRVGAEIGSIAGIDVLGFRACGFRVLRRVSN